MNDKLTRSVKETGRVVAELNERIDQLTKERDEARELVHDCFNQACQISMTDGVPLYSHDFLSTWEEAQDRCIEWGFVKPEECQYYSEPCTEHEFVPSEEYFRMTHVPKDKYCGMETCKKCRVLRVAKGEEDTK